MNKKRILLITIFFIIFYILVKISGLDRCFSIEIIKNYSNELQSLVSQNYFLSILIFIAVYIFFSATPLPGDSILIITAGYLFGMLPGTIYTIIAITLGSICAFLIFRNLIKNHNNYIQYKSVNKLRESIKKSGATYFLVIRILPILPVSVINFLAALSPISLKTFIWTTAIGIIPIALIYTYAGTRMHEINTMKQILTIPIIFALVLIALGTVFPKLLKRFKKNKI